MSDFIFPNVSADSRETVERMMRAMARRHDLVAVKVSDPAECAIPDVGLVELEDPESGEVVFVDTSSESVRREFAAAATEEANGWARFFRRSGIDVLELSTDKPYVDDVRSLFKRRARKRR